MNSARFASKKLRKREWMIKARGSNGLDETSEEVRLRRRMK